MDLNLNDKIRGMLFGFAIGDALGVGTEFMTKKEAAVRYRGGLKHYDDIIRDGHRSQYRKRDWTLDTEMLLVMVEYLYKNKGYDLMYMARTLKEWWNIRHPLDAPACVRFILQEPGFEINPLGTAQEVWTKMGRFEASNEALQRSLVMGLWPNNYIKKAVEMTLLTHSNSRCAASAAVIAHTAHELFYNDRVPTRSELVNICSGIDAAGVDYINAAHDKGIESLELDDEDTLWFVRKAMASALWCLWHDKTPQETLDIIVAEGGDSDTNAANAMGLAGLRYGIDAMPKQLVDDLLQKERVEDTARHLVELVEIIANHP